MDKVFCYLRVSGDSQLSGDGFPRQTQACREYAGRHGLRIKKFFREEAVSGTTDTMDRPAWNAPMETLHSDGVRTILIERLNVLTVCRVRC